MPASLEVLTRAADALHAGRLTHVGFYLVKVDGGGRQWSGYVEMFEVEGHPTATRVYAWEAEDGRCLTALNIPPIVSPRDAVRVALARRKDNEEGRTD